MIKSIIKTSLIAALFSASVMADSVENMAQSLIELRSEVEALNTQLQESKDAYKGSMKSLVNQKNALEANIAREDLKIKQIDQELSKVQKEIKEASKNSDGMKPVVLEALDIIEQNINDAIPFKTKDRLADVERIRNQLNSNLVTPQKALVMAYNVYSDAIRMTKENGIFKQSIKLNGQDKLVEIARIGTVMMYFKTPDNEVGYVIKDSAGYNYQLSVAKDEQDMILALFDAFRKQIRAGYFTLPNALISMEAN